jgi:DNA repair protein RadA/Sms
MIEERETKAPSQNAKRLAPNGEARSLLLVDSADAPRISTGMAEVDRVLGGGLVHGGVVLVGGDPGMGKSTLTLQICASIGREGAQALYVTGEESLHQIKHRADRLGLDVRHVQVASETTVENIAGLVLDLRPVAVVVDSIQTITTDALESTAGSVAQVRECAALLTRVAKTSGIPLVLIGHVTKDGFLAGPKVLEHIVDTVLQFEGEGMHSYRIVRSLKNRYGSTNEIGVFDMTARGLEEVHNPSEVLLSNRHANDPGTAVVAVMEGTRPLLVEVQALVSSSGYATPQRVSTGYDGRRLQLLLAVLEKRGGISVRQQDVFVNVAGGINIQDPAMDLGVAMAIASSATDSRLPPDVAFVGELGLSGEVRRVAYLEQRVLESQRLGIGTVVVPPADKSPMDGTRPVHRLSDLITDMLR